MPVNFWVSSQAEIACRSSTAINLGGIVTSRDLLLVLVFSLERSRTLQALPPTDPRVRRPIGTGLRGPFARIEIEK